MRGYSPAAEMPSESCSADRAGRRTRINDASRRGDDLDTLEQLNRDYVRSDQLGDFKRLDELLAHDFIAQLPGSTHDRAEFLEYIATPRPYQELTAQDVDIRILSDVALIHGRSTYTMLADGDRREALYTGVYQKRGGTWLCVAMCAIAPGA